MLTYFWCNPFLIYSSSKTRQRVLHLPLIWKFHNFQILKNYLQILPYLFFLKNATTCPTFTSDLIISQFSNPKKLSPNSLNIVFSSFSFCHSAKKHTINSLKLWSNHVIFWTSRSLNFCFFFTKESVWSTLYFYISQKQVCFLMRTNWSE